MMKVDTHAHVFKPGLPLASVRRYAPTYTASKEDFIAHFESHELVAGLLIQPSFLGTDNSHMIEAIDGSKGRLFGVAVVDAETITREELEELRKHRIIGIRLNLYGVELPDLRTDTWQHLLAYVKEVGWHVELHYDASKLIPFIDALLEAGVKIVVDHFGKPNVENPLEDEGFNYLLQQGKTKQIWVKVSACYRLGGLEKGLDLAKMMIGPLLEAYGADRILWGSDWPHTQFEEEITYERMWEVFEELVPVEYQNTILSTSFIELLPN